MKVPEDHRTYLKRKDFILDCAAPNFTAGDRELLTRFGHWLTALANREIQPYTPAQEHFLKMVRGEAEPENDLERAWEKLVERREFEAGTRAGPHFEISDRAEEWFSRNESWRSKIRRP